MVQSVGGALRLVFCFDLQLTSHAGLWFEEPASGNMLHAPTTEAVAPSTLARIDLEIGSQVKIPIFIFKATTEAKVPSLKMYNLAAIERGEPSVIQRQSEYVCSEKPEVSLFPHEVVAGAQAASMPASALFSRNAQCTAFPYGKSIVPMDNAERAVIEARVCSVSMQHSRLLPFAYRSSSRCRMPKMDLASKECSCWASRMQRRCRFT